MEFDAAFFALALPAAFISGVAKGGFGGGAAFVATAILAVFLDPTTALGIMLPLLIVADVATLRPFWGKWHWPSASALIIGGVPGILLGALLYKSTNPDILRVLIGCISLGFVAFQVAKSQGWLLVEPAKFSKRNGVIAGVISGFTSFVSHAGGPPAALFLLSQGMGKTTYQATTVIAFAVVNAMKAVPYGFLGVYNWDTLTADLYMLPFMIIGVVVGVYAHRAMPERYFFLLTYALLLGAGVKLIFDGLT